MTKRGEDETPTTTSLHDTLHRILSRVQVVKPPEGPTPEELEKLHAEHRRRRWLVVECGVPEKDVDRCMGLEPVQETPSVAIMRQFWDDHAKSERNLAGRRILIVAGPHGVGKSTAAAWLVAKGPPRPYMLGPVDARIDPRKGTSWPAHRHPRFVSAGELAFMSPLDAIPALQECSVLVLDDLGVEILDGEGKLLKRLDRLLDARYRQFLWTVITTNMTADEFRRTYTPRIVSRLFEAGDFYEVPGESLR